MYLCMRYVGTYLLYIGTYLFILGLVGVDCLPACPFFLLAPSHMECVGGLCVCGLCVSVAGGGADGDERLERYLDHGGIMCIPPSRSPPLGQSVGGHAATPPRAWHVALRTLRKAKKTDMIAG